eukprot:Pgem_evm1s462
MKHVRDQMYVYDDKCKLWIENNDNKMIHYMMTKIQHNFKLYIFEKTKNVLQDKEMENIQKAQKKLGQTSFMKNCLLLLKGDPCIIDDHFYFNRIEHLFPLKDNKVYDFKQQKVISREKQHYFSCTTPCHFIDDLDIEKCETNQLFKTIFPNDELLKNVYKIIGYWLTGLNNEKLIFFMNGVGDNGKSVLRSIVEFMMSDMCGICDKSIVIERPDAQTGSHSSHLFPLINYRLAWCPEIKKTDKINTEMVKSITGNDPLCMRKAHNPKSEQHLLICNLAVPCNYMPEFDATDKSQLSRLCVIPFISVFAKNPEEEEKKGKKNVYPRIDGVEKILKDNIGELFTICALYCKDLFYGKKIEMCDMVNQKVEMCIEDVDCFKEFFAEKFEKGATKYYPIKDLKLEYSEYMRRNGYLKPSPKDIENGLTLLGLGQKDRKRDEF